MSSDGTTSAKTWGSPGPARAAPVTHRSMACEYLRSAPACLTAARRHLEALRDLSPEEVDRFELLDQLLTDALADAVFTDPRPTAAETSPDQDTFQHPLQAGEEVP